MASHLHVTIALSKVCVYQKFKNVQIGAPICCDFRRSCLDQGMYLSPLFPAAMTTQLNQN